MNTMAFIASMAIMTAVVAIGIYVLVKWGGKLL